MSELVAELKRRHQRVKGERGIWDAHWAQVAERVLPSHGDFQGRREPGSKRTERIFDSTAVNALPKFASALESLMIPTTQKWHGVRVTDEKLNERDDVKRWCETVRDIMFTVRGRPLGRFQHNANMGLKEVGAFGNGVLFVEDDPGRNILYRAVGLSQLYFMENFAGSVDTVHREWRPTARQMKQMFGELPLGVRTRAEANPDREFTVLHCVKPSDEMTERKYRQFGFSSWYVCLDTDEQLEESGYYTMPYMCGRFEVAPGEVYGRGPAMFALADIKMINEMSKTNIRAAHKAVDPPMNLAADGVLQAYSMTPGALNWGGVDGQGRQLAVPLQTGAQLPVALEMEDQRRRAINDHFYITLFMILVENREMTASEAMLRAQEKGQLLGPSASRLQSDWFGPMFAREFDILFRAGVLPQPPRGVDLREVTPEYTAPLNRLIRAEDAIAMMRWVEQMAPMAEVKGPGVYDVVDEEKWGRELAEIDGVPIKVLRSPQEVAAMREDRAQAQELAAGAEVAATAGKAAESMANAAATAQQAGPALPLPLPA